MGLTAISAVVVVNTKGGNSNMNDTIGNVVVYRSLYKPACVGTSVTAIHLLIVNR